MSEREDEPKSKSDEVQKLLRLIAVESAKVLKLEEKLSVAIKVLSYTQRTDVVIGHEDNGDDNLLKGMPDQIMMRNRCKIALDKITDGKERS
jgi:hypothetical protein